MIEVIKKFRDDYRLRQSDAEKLMGVKSGTWSSWERGKRAIPTMVIKFIEQYRALYPVQYDDNRTHYVYKITNKNTNEYYIGMRSCIGEPLDDPYIGSSNWSKVMMAISAPVKKEVLALCKDRSEAYKIEQEWFAKCDGDELCVNKGLPSLVIPKIKKTTKDVADYQHRWMDRYLHKKNNQLS